MGLRDAMRSMGANPTHNGAAVAQQVTIQCSKGTAGESKFGGTIMRKDRISMLQERDEHQPVVHPVSPESTRNVIDDKIYQP